MKHLAIFKGEGGNLILTGKKTIESRFSRRKDPPFGQISTGDLVYIKQSGKDIIGQFRVKKVIFYDGLTPDDVSEIEERFGKKILVGLFIYTISKKRLILHPMGVGLGSSKGRKFLSIVSVLESRETTGVIRSQGPY